MIKLFCYGSLNQGMIEALLGEKLSVQPQPGILFNHVRIFAAHSNYWRGAVASIYPCKGKNVYGAIIQLNREQFKKIDVYEGGYRKVQRKIYVSDVDTIYCNVYQIEDHYFDSYPSERYLKSIRTTLNDVGFLQIDHIHLYGVFRVADKDVLTKVLPKNRYTGMLKHSDHL